MDSKQAAKPNAQAGQTLIETIVAVFILTMALSSGLGLAIYAMNGSALSKDQLIATNLAREGIEVVRMMRDTNWLSAGAAGVAPLSDCTYTSGAVRPCYPDAFRRPFHLQSLTTPIETHFSYRLEFNQQAPSSRWEIGSLGLVAYYYFCLQPNGVYRPAELFPQAFDCPANQRKFARQVTITTGLTADPYTVASANPTAAAGHSPEKIVRSIVIWQGKNCPAFPSNPMAIIPYRLNTRCRVEIFERLSNWKDY